MIINTALILAVGVALLATIATAPRAHARGENRCEAPSDRQPRRRLGVLGCAPERDRQQALRAASGDKSGFPPRSDADRVRLDHRPPAPSKLPRELQARLSRPEVHLPRTPLPNSILGNRASPLSDLLVIEFPSDAKAEGVREMLLPCTRSI